MPICCGYGTISVMAPKRFDKTKLKVWWGLGPLHKSLELAELRSGGVFPKDFLVLAQYEDGPVLQLLLGVRDGQAAVKNLAVSTESPDGLPITASMVHDLPLGQMFDEAIGQAAVAATALASPQLFVTLEEATAARAEALASRRGRPVSEENLLKVAAIVRANTYDPRQEVRRELHVSERTASRWIAEARSRGLVTEEENK